MRRAVRPAVLATALGLLLHACAQPKTSRLTTPAKIVFEHTEYDFGAVEQGTSVRHTYAIKNAGGLDLTIDNVRAACGCTTAVTPNAHALIPGADGGIDVTFDTANTFGPQNRTITVYSNDPATPAVTLTLTGSVHVAMAADPPQLYVGHLGRTQPAPQDVRLIGTGSTQLGAVGVSGNSIEAVLAIPPGSSDKRLHVSIRKDAPLGKFSDTVAVHTSSPRHPLLAVRVTGVVDGAVVIAPAEVNFGTTTPQAQLSRVIEVRRRGPQPLHISGLHLLPELGSAVATPRGEDYRITVTLNAGLHPGKISATLMIETDDPEQAHIEVPCIGRVVERS